MVRSQSTIQRELGGEIKKKNTLLLKIAKQNKLMED
jgi:hypothetical protein